MLLLELINPDHWVRDWLSEKDLSEGMVSALTITADIIVLVLIAIISDFITKRLILSLIARIVKRSKNKWDDYFYERKVFQNLAHLVPAILLFYIIPLMFDEVPNIILIVQKLIQLYIIVLIVIVIDKALRAFETLMINDERLVNSPLRTVSQVVRVLTFFIALVVIISLLSGIPIGRLLTVLAGTSAILILVFQDSIVGLLANLQITMYDLMRVGDWVTLNKQGVDGDVIAIDLTTVKIRNFDKTISIVPAKAFVQESFVNWRGMKEEGARRIKRNILIDINSVRFASEADLENFKKVNLVSDYITRKEREIKRYNETLKIDHTLEINGRRQTNIGVYRSYIMNYLGRYPRVDKNFMIMVRQLQPEPQGIPIEVYCFADTTVWAEYEGIQADIFDHLYAATQFFDLRLYQSPSGRDFRHIADNLKNQ
jgi:miniconductance mechanosensitive channel